jgi:hypothetical protein
VLICSVCLGSVICADEVSILRRLGTERFRADGGLLRMRRVEGGAGGGGGSKETMVLPEPVPFRL